MKRVAIALWCLATGGCFRSIGKTFGVDKSTCVEITHEFCKALVDNASEHIKFLETALEVGEAIQMFKDDVSCTPHKNPATRLHTKFNRTLSSARVTVERGFGIVKARYRILLKRQETTITNVSDVIISCFVLHNVCQRQNDQYEDHDGILQELIAKERAAKRKRTRNNTVCLREKNLRDTLMRYTNANY